MKVPFSLSLKISCWLLLNLALLAAAGLALLIAQGGLGWEGLVRGPAGDRGQAIADGVANELALLDHREEQDAALARYSHDYGVEFLFFATEGRQIAGPEARLPAAVRARLQSPGPRNPPRRPEGPARLVDRPEELRPPKVRREPPDRGPDRGRRRIFVKTEEPANYWMGWSATYQPSDRGPAEPAILLVRTATVGSLLRLLNLQPWLLAGIAVPVLSLLLWLPLVRGLTRALARLTDATSQIAEGRFDTRVPDVRGDEIGALGQSVNRMADRLDTLVNGQKRFLGDVAHELGSPIGRMQVAIEILEERCDPALRPQVADVREEIQLMGTLVGELLALTRAGLRGPEAALAPVEVAPLVARVLAREDTAGRVQAAGTAGLTVRADARLLERAIGNLVRNALHYAAEAGPVTLTGRVEGPEVILTLADAGPGVPPEALARLGEPFYRPEAARTREGGGVGLGLAIVKSGIEACQGRVGFRNRQPHGFEAELRLRRAT